MKPDTTYIQKHNFILLLVIYFRFFRGPIRRFGTLKKILTSVLKAQLPPIKPFQKRLLDTATMFSVMHAKVSSLNAIKRVLTTLRYK
ncbi:MAG: hypothetical protein JW920_03910 [Deltaproteobacteria bacterium]|nr:hypothetical protein [Deltaproteobacteria bacterium]